MSTYHAYCDYVLSPQGSAELTPLLDRITTNKTDFFREAGHFEYLTGTAPAGAGGDLRCRIQTAAGSVERGLLHGRRALHPGHGAERIRGGAKAVIVSVSPLPPRMSPHACWRAARKAVYEAATVEPVPKSLKHKYLLRSKDPAQQMIRMGPALRAAVEFRHLNFMQEQFGFQQPFDVIFCRNVMIYFDKPTQERLVNRFYSHLRPGGYLFIGSFRDTERPEYCVCHGGGEYLPEIAGELGDGVSQAGPSGFFGSRPLVVETILGSCVGIVVYGRRVRGRWPTAFLPHQRGPALPEDTGRYVDSALAAILDRVCAQECRPRRPRSQALRRGLCVVLCYRRQGYAGWGGTTSKPRRTFWSTPAFPYRPAKWAGRGAAKSWSTPDPAGSRCIPCATWTHRHSPLVTL